MTVLEWTLFAISLIGYFLIQLARANKERVRPRIAIIAAAFDVIGETLPVGSAMYEAA